MAGPTGPLSSQSPETEGMRRMITILVHQLGGAAYFDRAEAERVILEGWTVNITYDEMHNYTLKEVKL